MLEPADSHGYAGDASIDRVWIELGVEIVGLDSTEPLHDVEAAYAGQQAEVAALGEIGRYCRIHR